MYKQNPIQYLCLKTKTLGQGHRETNEGGHIQQMHRHISKHYYESFLLGVSAIGRAPEEFW